MTATYAGDANFTGSSATESHTVVAPPLIAKSFSPNAVLLNQPTTLTITITNPAANTVALTGVGLTDNFPAGLEVDATPMIGNSCNTGGFAPVAGATSLSLSNATIPVGVACTFSVKVKATTPGLKTNTTGAVSSGNGGNGLTASAQLQVNGPPVIAPIPLNLAAGSAAKSFDIATINDAEDGPLPLVFRLSADGNTFGTSASKNGVTVNFVSVGADGKVKAEVSTSCTATTATFTLKATDRDNQMTTVSWTVTIAANTPPTLSYAGVSVPAGATPSFTPAGSPADNGAITGINLQSITPATGLALSVNNSTGVVTVTNASIGGMYTVVIRATDDCGLMTDASFTVQVGCPAISLGPATLPTAAVNTAYPHSLTASPAGTNYNFAVTGGALPAGLTLNANGSFSGAPTNSGVFNFLVTVSGWGGGCTAFRDYVLVVDCPTVTVNPANLPGGTVGTNYNQTISASPSGSYGYRVTSGALPPGLTLNAATGAIAGTPTQAGSFAFTVTAAVGGCSGARGFTLVIGCPTITLPALSAATAGVSYTGSVAASPGGDYVYSLLSGNLPAGMTLNPATGALTGSAAVTGTYNFTAKALAANRCSGSQSYSLAVVCPTVTLSALNAPALNVAYSQAVTALPAGGNYSFAVVLGVLPAGLSLNPASGLLSGTPNLAGTYNFTIAAAGFGGCAGNREYSFVIGGAGCPAISLPGSLPAGSVGQLYTQTVTASPVGTYSYAVATGSLPPGVTLFGSQGSLYGYPTAPGSYSFTIRATGANNCAASQSYSVNIGLGMLPESLPQAVVGQAYRQTLTAPGAQGETWFTVVAGALPAEMTLSREGVLSGTPKQPGTHAFTVQAGDSAGFIGKRDYVLVFPPIAPPLITALTMTAAIEGCATVGSTATVTMTVKNILNNSISAVEFESNMPAGTVSVATSCTANLGTCTATPQRVNWLGSLNPNQIVTISFRVQFEDFPSAQTCITATARALSIFAFSASASVCAVNCVAAGPGLRLATTSPPSDVKAGSVLIYNLYTSATDPTQQNTRLSITNTDPSRQAFVHLFFVDGASCSVADGFLCLTPNQTTTFLASDLDPGTTGYIVAVAVDAAGCPTNFNFLIGDEFVKFQSGHAANLSALAVTAIAGSVSACDANASTAQLNFDGVSYAAVPRALALDNLPSRADGNDTMLILNRIGGNLGTGAATLGSIFGILYDDAESSLSFSLTGGCQLRGSLTNNFPRTAPRLEQFIPAGRSGWMKLYSQSDATAIGLTGAAINFNTNATANAAAFNQGHNLHALTTTGAMSYVVPVFPPNC
ncbi:MAG TPA: putative Ig domain-containing protein [Blastocatellia bacterium]|nr:putative Ig domain-containing protein [Blastocatellia bacterium]